MLATFQERLAEVVRTSGLNQSEFAASALIDRSTLSQLLLPTNRRLPRAETLAAIANRHQVSIDWLLGLSHAGPMQAEMMQEQTSFALDALAANDQRLIDWFADAEGYKIRYVPSTLPDLLKTETVIRHELDHYVASRPEQKIETASVRLAWTREPGSDMECCSSLQSLEGFARGEGIWRSLPVSARREQLRQIVDLTRRAVPHVPLVPVRRVAALRGADHDLRAEAGRALSSARCTSCSRRSSTCAPSPATSTTSSGAPWCSHPTWAARPAPCSARSSDPASAHATRRIGRRVVATLDGRDGRPPARCR